MDRVKRLKHPVVLGVYAEDDERGGQRAVQVLAFKKPGRERVAIYNLKTKRVTYSASSAFHGSDYTGSRGFRYLRKGDAP